jgi:hypothetical protein
MSQTGFPDELTNTMRNSAPQYTFPVFSRPHYVIF